MANLAATTEKSKSMAEPTSPTHSSAARDSSGSSIDSTFTSSSRPSSVTDEDRHVTTTNIKKFHINPLFFPQSIPSHSHTEINKTNKPTYLSRFSSVFLRNKTHHNNNNNNASGSSSVNKRVVVTAKEVVRRYLKKVKPLYERFSTTAGTKTTSFSSLLAAKTQNKQQTASSSVMVSHSFSGNLRNLRRKRSCVSSCPSSMRSSPTHHSYSRSADVLYGRYNSSTMEELQNAIQGAIAHCNNSWSTQHNIQTTSQQQPMVSTQ